MADSHQGKARRAALLAALLPLSACGTYRQPARQAGGWSCVPYARMRSGIALAGDAWTWWEAASGQYRRGQAPRPGAVLVLMRTSRLPQGHLAVVTRVTSSRDLRVDHANWGSGSGKGQIARDQPVQDVSPGNDWSLLRIWYPPAQDWGQSRWPAFGFIYPSASA
jgi:hypothetical protein